MSIKTHPETLLDDSAWEEPLRELRRSVASASGSQVMVCLYDSSLTLGQGLSRAGALARELDMPFVNLELSEEGINGSRALLAGLEALEPARRGLAAVTGLALWLRDDAKSTARLRQLNIDRDLYHGFDPPIQILFFIPEPLAGTFIRNCPDFWAYRSGLFLFPAHPEARMADTELLANEPHWSDTLTRQQKIDRIEQIQVALDNTAFEMPAEKRLHVRLLNEKGSLEHALAEYNMALKTYQTALEISKNNEFNDLAAVIINNLGSALKDLGDLKGAKEHYERALEIDKEEYGERHPSVAVRYNNLGSVLKDLGDLSEAKEYYERAMEIYKTVFGERHPNVAIGHNNLGTVLQDLGDLSGAKEHYESALEIYEVVFGKNHPNVAICLNNLGLVLKGLGDLSGAKEHLERVLEINRTIFGEKHPNVATCINNLGTILQDLGDIHGAKEYYERALEIDKEFFGEKHPNVASRYNNLGLVQQNLGDIQGAKEYYERALEIFEKFLGEDHPNTQLVRDNLKRLLESREAL